MGSGNDGVRANIETLVSLYRTGTLPLDEFESRLEPLLYQLADVTADQERTLREVANSLEFIRFTRIPESQAQAVEEALKELGQVLVQLA